jgi:hypothetical protein
MASYLEEFQALVDTYEHYGGTIGAFPTLVNTIKADSDEQRHKISRDKALAMSFLKRADRRRYGTLWVDLENQFSRHNDQYPPDLTEAYSLLVNYKATKSHEARVVSTSTDTVISDITGLTFAQTVALVPGTNNITHSHITCHKCHSKGHYACDCPTVTAVQLLQTNEDSIVPVDTPSIEDAEVYGFTFTGVSTKDGIIPDTWILLDSQSTVSIFKNENFLSNIRKSPRNLKVYTNGGTQMSSLIGDVANFGAVWYNPKSIANILSLAEVRRQCRVTMDTALEPALCVHKSDGNIMKFTEYATGLYYFEVANTPNKPVISDYTFVLTVEGNKERFHRREIEGADRARELYATIGRPSQQHFEHILRHNLIRNCPVTVDDAKRAQIIYGHDIATLKGKSTKTPAKHVPTFMPIPVPLPILEDHKDVTLCVDFFYVQGHPFFHTISRKIKFRTVSDVKNQKKETILKELRSSLDVYNARGFNVTSIHSDMEFECVQYDLLPTQFELTPRDAHVGEVERSIRTIKERVRSDIHGMPFKRLPKMLIIELVRRAVKVLNQFPALDGVSDTVSPLAIMTGKANPDYHHMKLDFGTYAQVFEDNQPTNTTKSRRTGAIALNPTGNDQGDYHFMSLTTGKRLARRQWTVIPMTAEVIAAVEARAEAEGQPLIKGGCPLFEWRPNELVNDDFIDVDEGNGENVEFVDDEEIYDEMEDANQPHAELVYDDPGATADGVNDPVDNEVQNVEQEPVVYAEPVVYVED